MVVFFIQLALAFLEMISLTLLSFRLILNKSFLFIMLIRGFLWCNNEFNEGVIFALEIILVVSLPCNFLLDTRCVLGDRVENGMSQINTQL